MEEEVISAEKRHANYKLIPRQRFFAHQVATVLQQQKQAPEAFKEYDKDIHILKNHMQEYMNDTVFDGNSMNTELYQILGAQAMRRTVEALTTIIEEKNTEKKLEMNLDKSGVNIEGIGDDLFDNFMNHLHKKEEITPTGYRQRKKTYNTLPWTVHAYMINCYLGESEEDDEDGDIVGLYIPSNEEYKPLHAYLLASMLVRKSNTVKEFFFALSQLRRVAVILTTDYFVWQKNNIMEEYREENFKIFEEFLWDVFIDESADHIEAIKGKYQKLQRKPNKTFMKDFFSETIAYNSGKDEEKKGSEESIKNMFRVYVEEEKRSLD